MFSILAPLESRPVTQLMIYLGQTKHFSDTLVYFVISSSSAALFPLSLSPLPAKPDYLSEPSEVVVGTHSTRASAGCLMSRKALKASPSLLKALLNTP